MLHQLLLLAALAATQSGESPSDAPVRRPAATAQQRAPGGETAERVYTLLRRARDPKAPFRKELPGEIAKTGSQGIGPLLAVLQSRRVPAQGALPEQTLSVYQTEVLLIALERIGAREVLAASEKSLGAAPGLDARVSALRVQGALGTGAGLGRVFELAADPQAQELQPELEDALRTALAGILTRDPEAASRLGTLWQRVPPPLLPAVVFAFGDAHDGRGLSLLFEALAAHPDLLPVVAAQVARTGRSPWPEVNREVCTHLREEFAKATPQLSATLLQALGALDDADSIELFIAQLSSEHEAVRTAAQWSLQHASCTDKADAAAWERWYDAEAAWQRTTYPQLAADLDGEVPTRIVDAVRQLRAHPLYRHAVARDLGALLRSGTPSLRALACRMMDEIGSIEAAPALVAALSDEHAEVAGAARDALKRITGRDLGANAQAWATLAGDRTP